MKDGGVDNKRELAQIAIWALIGIYIVLELVKLFFYNHIVLNIILFGIPVTALALHAILSMSFRRAVIFFLFAGALGFTGEWIGIKYGDLVGGGYHYRNTFFDIAGVPLAVTLYWPVFLYLGASMTNLILRDSGGVFIRACVDGIVLVAFDLLMDPIQVAAGAWYWEETSWNYDVPIGNFLGWFFTTWFFCFILRRTGVYFVILEEKRALLLVTPLLYTLFVLVFIISGIFMQMNLLVFVGLFVTLPIALLGIRGAFT